ncbi:Type I secretion system ATP-binding protein PrsD [Starkeya nomas]|uniref:Type I secretion system ATP-binding protein PrsD n=1 Tax=Starkeya nomas TaxID=2666134 RepID=A0A5S9PA41_9HYPH|nr:type I secretion system permease/ATPase [Starkeya nomas]CAA0100483.1 Type I secretion system ATP-binding protein PrsD [Starkeya nomas]
MKVTSGTHPASPVSSAFASCRNVLIGIGALSCVINLLMLTGPFFMLQIYDRVLASRSVPTLVALLILAAGLYAFQGLLDLLRARVLVGFGMRLDSRLRAISFDLMSQLALRRGRDANAQQPLRDLDQLRQFLSGQGPVAIFDLPWMPLYLAVLFIFHTVLGLLGLAGIVVLCTLMLITEFSTKGPTRIAARRSAVRNSLADSYCRNVEPVAAMGMKAILRQRWNEAHAAYLDDNQRAVNVSGDLSSMSKVFRFLLQSLMLAAGALLVIEGEASAGVMIAASILSSRALAPVELAISNWRGFVAARQSYARLSALSAEFPAAPTPMPLPAPVGRLDVEALAVAPPGQPRPTVAGLSFSVPAGSAVGVIGPSGSGKSTLARGLVGAWPVSKGGVRLDGAALEQWDSDALGRHLGYLPQDIELFDGTIAENVSRFQPDATPEKVIAACERAGVHEMILRLPSGYDTRLGEGGVSLSGGERQRVALARALYGEPFLIVLDEPNSNLDADGEAALTRAIKWAREAQRVVIVVAHRPSALSAVDLVLMMGGGQQQAFGPKAEILGRVLKQPVAA